MTITSFIMQLKQLAAFNSGTYTAKFLRYALFLSFFLVQSRSIAQTPELLYYRFDGTGTSVPNEASSPPSGTATAVIMGDLTQGSTGQCNGALIGTGSNASSNYVNTGWAPNLTGSSWTLSFWITNVPNYSQLWYIFGDANSSGFRCFTNGVAGPDNFWLRGGFTDVAVPGGAAAGPQVITFVYDISLNNIKAYLNGTLVNTIAQGSVNISGAGPLKVGGYSSNFGLAPGSRMDEFRLYNRALSATEVAVLAGNVCGCYTDLDGDGFGDANAVAQVPAPGQPCPSGTVSNNTDCNDFNDDVYPGATEICDGFDNDCNSIVDDGDDVDGDGYTVAQGDCDDCNDEVSPGATEVCNGIDDDCDGQVDEVFTPPSTCTYFYGFSPFQDSVWTVDTALNFAIIERRSPTLSGFTVTGINGAAKNPVDGQIYVIAKVSGVSGRVLCTFNPVNAALSQIGNLGDNFASLTFSPGGTLYGATGDGATTPETLYEINPATAAKTLLTALGNGADGEIICFNPDDNFIYHWSGNGTVVFEKIQSTPPYTVTNIPIVGSTNAETFGAAYVGNNKFLTSNINSTFSYYSTSGLRSADFGSMPDDLRGLPFGDCPSGPMGGLPDGWDNSATGSATGNASSTTDLCIGTEFTVSSTGFQPGLTGEAIQLAYKTICGNTTITAHITGISGGGWAGVSIRESLAAGSKMAALKTQGGNFVRRETRSITNGGKSSQQLPVLPSATWLRIQRSGNTFSFYTSVNGVNWTPAGSATVAMNSCVYVGLFAESINVNTTTTATFNNVTVTGNPAPLVAAPDNGFAQADGQTADLSVYPNPTTGMINVDLSDYLNRKTRIEVYNSLGALLKVIERDAVEDGIEQIDLSNQQNGVFLIRVQSEGVRDAAKRVVLNTAK